MRAKLLLLTMASLVVGAVVLNGVHPDKNKISVAEPSQKLISTEELNPYVARARTTKTPAETITFLLPQEIPSSQDAVDLQNARNPIITGKAADVLAGLSERKSHK